MCMESLIKLSLTSKGTTMSIARPLPVQTTPADRVAKLVRMIATLTGNKEVVTMIYRDLVLEQAHKVGLKEQLIKAYASMDAE